jgi:hypothetical protein
MPNGLMTYRGILQNVLRLKNKTSQPRQKLNRKWDRYIDFILIPLLLFFSLFSPHFVSGTILELDEGQHLASINELLRGAVPFRDIYFMHGPLLEYIPYWLMRIFGAHLGVLRGFYLFGNILSFIMFFMLLRVLVSNRLLRYSTLYFVLRYSMDVDWNTRYVGIRWAPGFGGLLLIYFWVRDGKKPYLFFTGLLCGLGLLISQEIGIGIALAASLAIFLRSLEQRANGRFMRTLARNGSVFSTGFVLAVSPLYLYFFIHQAFAEYIRIDFVDTLFLLTREIPYSRPLVSVSEILHNLSHTELIARRSLAFYGITLVYLIIIAWTLLNYRKRHRYRMISLLSLIAYGAVALKGVTRNLEGPQFCAAIPPALVAISMFLEIWLNRDTYAERGEETDSPEDLGRWRARLKHASLLIGVLVAIYLSGNPYTFFSERVAALWRELPADSFDKLDADIMPRAKGVSVYWPQASRLNRVVGFLREHTHENDRIFTFPCAGHINFLANRPAASRFGTAIYSKVREEYMQEIVGELKRNPPKFIIYVPGAYALQGTTNERRLRPVWQYIQTNYEFLVDYGNMWILAYNSEAETK